MSTISKILSSPPDNFSTTLNGNIQSDTLTITVNSVTGLGTEGIGVIYKKDSDGNPITSSIEFVHWTGVSGSNLTLTDTGDRGITGSANGAQSHDSGDTFEVWVHSKYYLGTFAAIEHNTDGTHNKVTSLANATPIEQKNAAGTSKYLIGRNASNQTILYDVNNNEVVLLDSVASAVNYIKQTNSATGNQVTSEAAGDDSNIGYLIKGKGTKGVEIKDLAPTVVTLTDGANIATDASLGNYFKVTLAGSRTMDAPTNPTEGQIITYAVTQGGSGSLTISWSSASGGFNFGTSGSPTLSTTVAKVDILSFRYNAALSKWLYLGSQIGF